MSKFKRTAVLLVGLALVAAACSSDSKSSSASKDTSTTAEASGPVTAGRFTFPGGKPTGDPYTIYYLGTFAATDTGTPELPPTVKAVTKAVNEELGGIGGHPLKLVFCDENADPATGTACANQAIAAKPLAIGGFPLVWDKDNRQAVTAAGIMDFSASSAASNFSADTTLYATYGSSSSLFSVVGYAKEEGIKSAEIITLDIAPAVAGAKLTKSFLEKVGVKVGEPITHASNAADMSTPILKALQSKPDLIIQINGPRECGRGVAAAAEQGYDGTIWLTPNCNRKDVFDQAGAGKKLIVTVSEGLLASPKNPEQKLLTDILNNYHGGSYTASTLQAGGSLLTLVDVANRVAKAKGGTLTSADLIEAYKNISNQPAFAGYVLDKANEPPFGLFAHLYNSFYRYFSVKDDGSLVDTGKWYSAWFEPKPGLGADAGK